MQNQTNIRKKNGSEDLQPARLARSSSVMAFQNCLSEPMLSSEDVFSYAIARTEKSGSNGQQ